MKKLLLGFAVLAGLLGTGSALAWGHHGPRVFFGVNVGPYWGPYWGPAYYPYVKDCSSGWRAVPPAPTSAQ